MEYITLSKRGKISNTPYVLSSSELLKMIEENEKDIRETEKVTQSSYRGETYYYNDGHPGNEKILNNDLALFKEILYRDKKTNGFVMRYPHGTVICQGEHNSYYRGENQIYPSSLPNLYRKIEKLDEEEKEIYRFVAQMRLEEFKLFLNKMYIVQLWLNKYGSILYEPLAQHYGLETEWLDITSDLNVALFFATCKYNSVTKQWQPLTKEDTEKNDETKFGVIFHIPNYQEDMIQMTASLLEENNNSVIIPVGYQPFMRCHVQHAYSIHMDNPFPLQQNGAFEKLYFRHDEHFSKVIFEKMNRGRQIYPQEGLLLFDDVIEKIKTTSTFSRLAYNNALQAGFTEEKIKNLLERCDCDKIFGSKISIIDKDVIKISRQRIRVINRKYKDFSIEKNYGIKLVTRGIFTQHK